MNELEDFLKTHDAGTVLDIACGSGAFTKRLTGNLKSYTSVIGLDIKADTRDDFLEAVQGHDISFVASSIHDYIESTGRFDTISVSNALHHLEGVGEVVKSVCGILNAGGTFIVNEMHGDDLTPTQQTQHDQHRFLADLQRSAGEYHRETWSRDEILGFITHAGLRVQHSFENNNEDALVTKEPGRLVERAQAAIDKAYPDGAPESITAELDRLVARNNEIGSSSPPQLTLVCVGA
jgi:2-polyprenyl-3-methyl-5-hydroxy-6-metoxy-1,4-benzoquinol methylase